MKPTELYFEPVLIGLATLLTAAMIGSHTLESWLLHAGAGEITVAIAAAYFVGIVVDRVADAILDPLNHHHRLLFALKEMRREGGDARLDPFPEDAYHIATIRNEQASEYVYYLRSRIRLMRAMLVLAPGFGVGVALRITDAGVLRSRLAIGVVCATYGLAILLRCRETEAATPERLCNSRSEKLAPPRTADLLDPSIFNWYRTRIGNDKPFWKFAIRNEPLTLAAVFLAVFAGVVAGSRRSVVAGILTTGGTLFVVSTLAWCWWRITSTFFTFLRNYSGIPSPRNGAA